MITIGSCVHKPMINLLVPPPPPPIKLCLFANFWKYWWFQTKQFIKLLEFLKLYKYNPLDKCLFSPFTKTIPWLHWSLILIFRCVPCIRVRTRTKPLAPFSPGTHQSNFDTNLHVFSIHNFSVLAVQILRKARFCLQLLYHAILIPMLLVFLHNKSIYWIIIRALMLGTNFARRLSVHSCPYAWHTTIYWSLYICCYDSLSYSRDCPCTLWCPAVH